MSNHCTDEVFCPNGNCPGCKNGEVWCQDQRCSPYCKNCSMQKATDYNGNLVVIIILIVLVTILFIIWFVYGPSLIQPHSSSERANSIMIDNSSVKI